VDEHTSVGALDPFLSKFDSNGEFQWARTWGGPGLGFFEDDAGYGVALDGFGDVYVVGEVYKPADYDPGPGVDEHDGGWFLSKFDSDGDFVWAIVDKVPRRTVAADEIGGVYVIGAFFSEVADLDPGPGVDEHEGPTAYIVKLLSAGGFQWARSWGSDKVTRLPAVESDGSGSIRVGGGFTGTADFDPGPGTDYHTTNSATSAFISSFSSDGDFLWARTWGEPGEVVPLGFAVDPAGNSYTVGYFKGIADFDPGPDADYHASNGSGDIFLCKLPPDGDW